MYSREASNSFAFFPIA
jgi:hypothetical protein